MRINISINDKLLEQFDKHCDSLFIDRSGMISQLIRNELFEEQVYPGIGKDKREIGLSHATDPGEGVTAAVIYSPNDELRQAKKKIVGGINKIAKVISKQKGVPKFCPKHNGQIVGDRYSCGCSLK